MKKLDCLTIGSSTQDIMYYTDESVIVRNKKDITRQKLIAFEYGAKLDAQATYFTFGGGANNVAVALSRLGMKTGIITTIGDDGRGKEIKDNLQKHKINIVGLQVKRQSRSGFAFIVNTGRFNEHVIFTCRGASNQLQVSSAVLKKIRSDWYYLSSLQGNFWKSNLRNIFSVARHNQTKIAWNPGSVQLQAGYKFLKKYLQETEILIVNQDEAIELVLSYGKKVTNLEKLLITIRSWGPQIVVITCAQRGAYVFDGQKMYYRKALAVKPINTTGAGDSFGSTFLWGIVKLRKISLALQAAILNSNNVITEIGAQNGLLTAREIKTKLKK